MIWTLILIINSTGFANGLPPITSLSIDFETQARCVTAGETIQKDLRDRYTEIKFTCVRKL
jgi:hypothetical protein